LLQTTEIFLRGVLGTPNFKAERHNGRSLAFKQIRSFETKIDLKTPLLKVFLKSQVTKKILQKLFYSFFAKNPQENIKEQYFDY
jgi:hypothetical protein